MLPPTVEVTVRDGEYVAISISDEWAEIDMEQQDRLQMWFDLAQLNALMVVLTQARYDIGGT